MNKRLLNWIMLALALLTAICLLVTCAEKVINDDHDTAIQFKIAVTNAGTDLVTRYVATISAPDMDTVTAELYLSEGMVVGRIDNVAEGNGRTVVLEGIDSAGTVVYRGETTDVTVTAGTTVTVNILMVPQVPMIRLAPAYTTGLAGDSIAIDIKAYNLDSLTMLELALTFDTSSLSFRQVLPLSADSTGDWLDGTTRKIIFWGGTGAVGACTYDCQMLPDCQTLTDLGIDVTAIEALGIADVSDVYTDGMTARIGSYRLQVTDTVEFVYSAPGTDPSDKAFTVREACGNGSVDYSLAVLDSPAWLTLRGTAGGSTPGTHNLGVTTAGLDTSQVYSARVRVVSDKVEDTSYIHVKLGFDRPEEPCDSLVRQACDLLASKMDEAINVTWDDPDSTFRPGDVDFTDVLDLFERALYMCPDHDSARFGAALSGVMVFMADPDLNDLYEQFKNMYDTGGAFPVAPYPHIGIGGNLAPAGIPMTPSALPKVFTDFTRLHSLMAQAATTDPTITDVQNLFENSLMPKLVLAQERVEHIIQNNQQFKFVISPAMQGDPGASAIVVDLLDFRTVLATTYAAEATIHIFVARNFDLPSYTMEGIEQAVQQSSDFTDLKSDGRAHMQTALRLILDAEEQAELAGNELYAILAAGYDHSDGILVAYRDDSTDVREIVDSLVKYREYFNGPKEMEIILDDDDTLTEIVDLAQFFDNPVNNLKSLLPAYVVTIDSNGMEHFAAEHFSSAAYWDSLQSIYDSVSYPNDTLWWLEQYGFRGHLPDDSTSAEFYQFITGWDTTFGGYYDKNQSIFGWDDLRYNGYGGVRVWVWDYYSDHRWDFTDFWESGDDIWVACFEWEATSYDDWTFPDPTFGGVMPNMTNYRLKYEVINDGDSTRWERSGCEYFDWNDIFDDDDWTGPIGPGH